MDPCEDGINMQQNARGKYGNLRLVPATRSPEEQLKLENMEAWSRVRGKDGRVVSRASYEIAEGVQQPDSVKARRILELRRAGVPKHIAWQTAFGPITRYFDRVYGSDHANTGEWPVIDLLKRA